MASRIVTSARAMLPDEPNGFRSMADRALSIDGGANSLGTYRITLSGACYISRFGTSDFNGDGDFGTDQDIEAFFRVLAGANC